MISHRDFAHHAAQIDHARWILWLRRGRQNLDQALREVKHTRDVQIKHFAPSVMREGAQRGAPAAAGIVQQYI